MLFLSIRKLVLFACLLFWVTNNGNPKIGADNNNRTATKQRQPLSIENPSTLLFERLDTQFTNKIYLFATDARRVDAKVIDYLGSDFRTWAQFLIKFSLDTFRENSSDKKMFKLLLDGIYWVPLRTHDNNVFDFHVIL